MMYDVEIIIRTKPADPTLRTELVESATVSVSANSYNEALERTFKALNTGITFKDFMDKANLGGIKYPEESKKE